MAWSVGIVWPHVYLQRPQEQNTRLRRTLGCRWPSRHGVLSRHSGWWLKWPALSRLQLSNCGGPRVPRPGQLQCPVPVSRLGIQTVFSLQGGESSLPDMGTTQSLTNGGNRSPLGDLDIMGLESSRDTGSFQAPWVTLVCSHTRGVPPSSILHEAATKTFLKRCPNHP